MRRCTLLPTFLTMSEGHFPISTCRRIGRFDCQLREALDGNQQLMREGHTRLVPDLQSRAVTESPSWREMEE
jgi:hypothetical protein